MTIIYIVYIYLDKDRVFRVDVVKLKSSEPVTQPNTGTQTSREISSSVAIPSSSHNIIPVQHIAPQTIPIPSSATAQYTLQQV